MEGNRVTTKNPAWLPWIAVLGLWLSQPPLGWWPVAFIALVPYLLMIDRGESLDCRRYVMIWAAGLVYWMVSLQGLRHAHPAMYACWLALSAYLAGYLPLFVWTSRQMIVAGMAGWMAVPIAWVGWECVRNYLLTGISAIMLGHSMANVPVMIQIADLMGTYGVSLVVASVNVAMHLLWRVFRGDNKPREVRIPILVIGVLLGATVGYGMFRLTEVTFDDTSGQQSLATFALIQRNEAVEYIQDQSRETQMAQRYADTSLAAARASEQPIDAFVWPESMFTGGVPWYVMEPGAKLPPEMAMHVDDLGEMVDSGQVYFRQRAFALQRDLQIENRRHQPPHLIVGCSVIRYAERPYLYSGVTHIHPDGERVDWYGKTHLVMFGEYIPLVQSIPFINAWLPPGMGIDLGPGPQRFMVNTTGVSPNICIETAVERVTLNHLAQLLQRDQMPDVVVTVTNDGWFHDSSVLEHHLRCAQLVAVAGRRPILSAANNGPTAWIDSRGQVVERLVNGTQGWIIATPERDTRTSVYLAIGDWPARGLAFVCVGMIGQAGWRRVRRRSNPT